MYDRIEARLKGVQQALYSSHAVSIVPPSYEGIEVGDEPNQRRKIEDATEGLLCHVQEENEHAT
jgi:hypothetical protein